MAEQRLSKLQKWILVNCFKVTIMLDRSELVKPDGLNYCYDKDKCPSYIIKKRNGNNVINMLCSKNSYCKTFHFYKEDVLLSYFKLVKCKWKSCWDRVQHFKQTEPNNKAYVTLHRSIKNLDEKGLIYVIINRNGNSINYELTDKGIETAMNLLNLDDHSIINEPPLLTNKECENERKKIDLEIKAIMAKF